MVTRYYGGIEGGGTKTSFCLYDADAKEIGCILDGPSSNFFVIGKEEAVKRLVELIRKCFSKVGLPSNTLLESLGLCLSGGENEKTNEKIKALILSEGVAKSLIVRSDTLGPLATLGGKKGLVLIAGTGSNCLSASGARCGGWGSFIGNEGSAHWIAQLATTWIFHSEDNFAHRIPPLSQEELSPIKDIFMKYFQLEEMSDILPHCYDAHSKSHYAGVTKIIAEHTRESSDPVGRRLFTEAGAALAHHVLAVEKSVEEDLDVLCIGSLWLSWDLLEEGFIGTLERHSKRIQSLRLLTLKKPSALGAAHLGALEIGVDLPMDFTQNYDVFFQKKVVQ